MTVPNRADTTQGARVGKAPVASSRLEKYLGVAVCLLALAAGIGAGLWRRSAAADAGSLSERRGELAALSSPEKDQLRRQYTRFNDLSSEQREQLRAFHDELHAADDADALGQTMRQYHDWLRTLSLAERGELLKLAGQPARKADRVAELSPLSPADNTLVERWNRGFSPPKRIDVARLSSPWAGGFGLDDRDFDRLAASLSPLRSGELKRQAATGDKRRLVLAWLQRRRGPTDARFTPASAEELLEFYTHDSTEESRRKLVAAPVEQRNRELRDEYRKFQGEVGRFSAEDLNGEARKQLADLPPERRDQELRAKYRQYQRMAAFLSDSLDEEARKYLRDLPKEQRERELRGRYPEFQEFARVYTEDLNEQAQKRLVDPPVRPGTKRPEGRREDGKFKPPDSSKRPPNRGGKQ
jgi:hypothetical protein